MNSRIMTFINGLDSKKVGIGVAAFCGGFGLGLYFGRPRVSEIVIDVEETIETEEDVVWGEELPDNVRVLRDVKLSDISEDVEPNPVLHPAGNDPKEIDVDLDALRRRDQLIEEFGFTEGMRLYQKEYSQDGDDEEETAVNVFASELSEWDQDEEERGRSTSAPYILHKDEFWRDDQGYSQTTLTYYSGDDILVDQDEKPVYNYSTVVGELRFGHGSQDRNVVYIRNDRLKAEYEVIRDRGRYEVEVLGLEAEEQQERASLKHSLGKFRMDD